MARSLLDDVAARLDAAGVSYALVGAGALAAHGIARATFDLDLFTTAAAVLDAGTWATLALDSRVDVAGR